MLVFSSLLPCSVLLLQLSGRQRCSHSVTDLQFHPLNRGVLTATVSMYIRQCVRSIGRYERRYQCYRLDPLLLLLMRRLLLLQIDGLLNSRLLQVDKGENGTAENGKAREEVERQTIVARWASINNG